MLNLNCLGTDVTGPPAYTVTSPRPSVASPPTASEMSHLVQAAADYKAKKAKSEEQEADHTVLLKLKQGDEYKLVLNMQQYSPGKVAHEICFKNIQSRPIGMRIFHRNERCRISAILRHRRKLFLAKIPYFSSKMISYFIT